MRISRKIIAAKITPGLIRRKQEMTERRKRGTGEVED